MTLPGEKFLDEVSGKWLTKSQIRRRRRQEAAWNVMFEKLREFKRVHNHCNVLRSDPDRELSSWVHTQRNRSAGGEEIGLGAALLCRSFVASNDPPTNSRTTAGLLVPYQRKLLEDLGFVFFLGRGFHHVRQEASDLFKSRFSDLEAFKEKHGHCRVPKIYKANQALSWWYHQLRPRRRRQLLSQEEVSRGGAERASRRQYEGALWLVVKSRLTLTRPPYCPPDRPPRRDRLPVGDGEVHQGRAAPGGARGVRDQPAGAGGDPDPPAADPAAGLRQEVVAGQGGPPAEAVPSQVLLEAVEVAVTPCEIQASRRAGKFVRYRRGGGRGRV